MSYWKPYLSPGVLAAEAAYKAFRNARVVQVPTGGHFLSRPLASIGRWLLRLAGETTA